MDNWITLLWHFGAVIIRLVSDKNKEGTILTDEEEINERREEYIQIDTMKMKKTQTTYKKKERDWRYCQIKSMVKSNESQARTSTN